MITKRPTVFIGSSREGLPIAESIQVNLDQCADVVLWSQGVFGLSDGTLSSLVNALDAFDFAILVLTPDDTAIVRDDAVSQPRDNVLFELGLFMGGLGRDRCFVVYDRTSQIKLPSDLAGVTAATFQPHASKEYVAALGSASTQIKAAINKKGRLDRKQPDVYIDAKTQYRVIADLLEPISHQFFILMHDSGITLNREEWYSLGIRYEYGLQKKGFGSGGFRVNDLCRKLADAGLLIQDLRGNVGLTERGAAFADWMINANLKADYFWSDVGSWGARPAELSRNPDPRSMPRTLLEVKPDSNKGKAES